jgi:hypothetical protein
MNAVITEKARVDVTHAIRITNLPWVPGEEVEVVVRSTAAAAAAAPILSLWDLVEQVSVDAPADYSVNFEQVLR